MPADDQQCVPLAVYDCEALREELFKIYMESAGLKDQSEEDQPRWIYLWRNGRYNPQRSSSTRSTILIASSRHLTDSVTSTQTYSSFEGVDVVAVSLCSLKK